MIRARVGVTGSSKRSVLFGAALDALATGRRGSVKLTSWHALDDTWLRADVQIYQWNYKTKQHLCSGSDRACGA